jgi:hypothetical protein
MVEAELLIGHLRNEVHNLQSLLNYLESRNAMRREEYLYLKEKLREVVGRLNSVRRWSSQREQQALLRAAWLN